MLTVKWSNRKSYPRLEEMQRNTTTGKIIQHYLKKLYTHILNDPIIPLPAMYPEETEKYQEIYRRMFIPILLIIAKDKKHIKYPSTAE